MRTNYLIKMPDGIYIAIADLVERGDFNDITLPAWCITRINVPKQYRGKGYGSKLLCQILTDADCNGEELWLWAMASDGLTTDQLIRWYKRHGFKSDGNTAILRYDGGSG